MDLYKAAFLLGAFICTGLEAQFLNYQVRIPEFNCITGNGATYRGTVGVTESGLICQNWRARRPHAYKQYSPMTHRYAGLDKNYCRNPSNHWRPWCYTTDPDVRWEYCDVPLCNNVLPAGLSQVTEECMHCNGENYRGTRSWTQNHVTCQRWDSQYPHRHDYGGLRLEGNYCRNPNKAILPWCFTTDPGQRWDYCAVPRCLAPPPPLNRPEDLCITGNGEDYRGTMSVTQNGYRCKRWSETPYKPELFPCSDLRHNYCRNVFGKQSKPWCFVGDFWLNWDYCNVPQCSYNIYQGFKG